MTTRTERSDDRKHEGERHEMNKRHHKELVEMLDRHEREGKAQEDRHRHERLGGSHRSDADILDR